MEEYFENYEKRNGKMLKLADIIAKTHRADKAKFSNKIESIFDKRLDDISLYRSGGEFITLYHSGLYNKRKNGIMTCPVFEISYKMYIQKERNKEYVRRVYSQQSNTMKKMELNLMDFNDAYDEFLNDYLNISFFHQDNTFVIDDQNKKVISDLVKYFTRQELSTLNLKKGICLYGDIGTGKSTIMKQFAKFTKDNDLPTQFEFVYMDDVYSDCDSMGLDSLNDYKFKACVFDDIGMRAESNVNNYGTKINAYKELVRRQYNRFTRFIPCLSHYTTNIKYQDQDFTEQLVSVFGARELDRFREMCNFVYLGGESRRK